ncbi:hypothetical protein [Aquimarina agarilytica]|uniref:hypothetical protein n=1 Tax=Aquimarina agarilytica TaxID=1087449 RepID=UPI0003175700|nr:hypothetical protein [Aquimarina agarilytica]
MKHTKITFIFALVLTLFSFLNSQAQFNGVFISGSGANLGGTQNSLLILVVP